jgi:rsbT co-antagonist protein RsbR
MSEQGPDQIPDVGREREPQPSPAYVVELQAHVQALVGRIDGFQRAVDALPMSLFWKDRDSVYLGGNGTFARDVGLRGPEELIGKTDYDLFSRELAEGYRADDREVVQTGQAKPHIIERMQTSDGRELWVETHKAPLRGPDGRIVGLVGSFRDITARQLEQEARSRRQEEVIRGQAETLLALATPLIPVAEGVLVMPLIGAIDAARAQQILSALLEGIAAHRARVAIVDLTGIHAIDSQVADVLLRAARAVSMLGARVMLTGMRAGMAQALVRLGVDLGSILTRSTLQAGIACALNDSAHGTGVGPMRGAPTSQK